MRIRKCINVCARGGLIVLLSVAIAMLFMTAKNPSAEIRQINSPSNFSLSHFAHAQSPATAQNSAIVQDIMQPETPCSTTESEDILILVNKNNKLPDDYMVNLTAIENAQVAKVLLDDLMEMRKASEKENIILYIRSAYRTHNDQKKAFDNAVSGYVNQGNSQNVAVEKAEQVVARPGYSEHQTGLAIDFSLGTDVDKQAEMWDWLSKNAHEYGFILRYPEGKERITGYTFEPWHYRYVGAEHAQFIYDKGLLFEEYLYLLENMNDRIKNG